MALWLSAAISCQPSSPDASQAPQAVARGKVTLGYIHQAPDAPQGRWTLQGGHQVELERFIWVVSDVELHACEPGAAKSAQAPVFERWGPWWISVASAHVPDSATRQGTPYAEDLLAPGGKARIVAELAPPLGEYCRLYAILAPADEDIYNFTELPTEQLRGKTYWIQGRLKRADAPDWTPFELSGALTMAAPLDAINPRDPQAPLALTAQHPTAFILLDKTLSADILSALFEPHALEPDHHDRTARALLTLLSARQRVYPSAPKKP